MPHENNIIRGIRYCKYYIHLPSHSRKVGKNIFKKVTGRMITSRPETSACLVSVVVSVSLFIHLAPCFLATPIRRLRALLPTGLAELRVLRGWLVVLSVSSARRPFSYQTFYPY